VAKIILDPGHGGRDPGGPSLGEKEKDIVLWGMPLLWKPLAEAGHLCIPTRVTDEFLEISIRSDFSNKHNADLFISIHANANENTKAEGFQIYHANLPGTRAEPFAKAVMLSYTQREKKKGWDGVLPDGQPRTSVPRIGVLWRTRAPAILLEMGFMSNKDDLARIQTESFWNNVGLSIVTALTQIKLS
jgi:N-acetylmuramoyl-L-alanine amidase